MNSPTLENRVKELIAEQRAGSVPVPFERSQLLERDLGLDSLDTVELGMAIEEEFGIPVCDTEKWKTVDDVITFVERAAK